MKRVIVLAVVLVLLVVMVSSVSAKATPILFLSGAASGAEHVIIEPPRPTSGEDVPSANHVVRDPPRPDPVSDGVTVMESGTIKGDVIITN